MNDTTLVVPSLPSVEADIEWLSQQVEMEPVEVAVVAPEEVAATRSTATSLTVNSTQNVHCLQCWGWGFPQADDQRPWVGMQESSSPGSCLHGRGHLCLTVVAYGLVPFQSPTWGCSDAIR